MADMNPIYKVFNKARVFKKSRLNKLFKRDNKSMAVLET